VAVTLSSSITGNLLTMNVRRDKLKIKKIVSFFKAIKIKKKPCTKITLVIVPKKTIHELHLTFIFVVVASGYSVMMEAVYINISLVK
jgi:hypothetical protein